MDVPWQRTFEDLGSLGTGKRHVIKIGREAVPIVFVPGIMGTRLRARVGGAPIWDPDDSWFMLKRFGLPGIDPRDRQATILGATRTYDSKIEYAVPFGNEESEHDRDIEGEFPNATRRGWSEVYWDVYRPIFSALHTARWPLFIARCFDLPVYACGYDWRGSARDAGRRLASRVASIMAEQKLPCRQVILVTHSMGGLVARSACKLDGLEKNVLGIVHVVQPVTGAPSAYWRMKAGLERKGGIFDRIASVVVGANGLEVTSLVANLPGGLQLLPNRDHRANDGQSARRTRRSIWSL